MLLAPRRRSGAHFIPIIAIFRTYGGGGGGPPQSDTAVINSTRAKTTPQARVMRADREQRVLNISGQADFPLSRVGGSLFFFISKDFSLYRVGPCMLFLSFLSVRHPL